MKRISMQGVHEEISFENAFKEFIRICKLKNLSNDTLEYYERCKNNFANYYNIENECSKIDSNVYMGFIEYLQKKEPKLKDTTINTNLRGIRAIINFYIEQKYTKPFKMHLMKIDKPVKEIYTEQELNRLLEKPNLKKCSFAEYRTWVMTNFVLGTGQRLSSMLNMKIGDISLEEREVVVRKTKGRKQLIIPLSTGLCKILEEYFQYRGNNPEEYLFPNQFGGKMSRSGAEDAVADYNRARAVSTTSIHRYRHTFAKMWIMNGGDIFSLQRMLGHSSLEMVKEYVNLFGGDLQIQYDKFNPLDSFQENQKQKVLKMTKNKR